MIKGIKYITFEIDENDLSGLVFKGFSDLMSKQLEIFASINVMNDDYSSASNNLYDARRHTIDAKRKNDLIKKRDYLNSDAMHTSLRYLKRPNLSISDIEKHTEIILKFYDIFYDRSIVLDLRIQKSPEKKYYEENEIVRLNKYNFFQYN